MKKMLKFIILAIGAVMIAGCKPQEVNSAGVPIGDGSSAATSTSSSTETKEPEKVETPTPESTAYQIPYPDRKPKDGEEVGVFETGKGRIVFMFFPDKAPNHVAQFKKLISKGIYDGTRFHRCIANFMVQGGDPSSKEIAKSATWGTGGYMENGKEVNIKAEFNDIKHKRGVMSTARNGNDINSASSQFFIMVGDSPGLDSEGNRYSAWGQVVAGMDVADQIVTTGDAANNGAVKPDEAIVLKTAKIMKWPVN